MKPRVLIIEDEATLAAAIDGFLRRQGATTHIFAAAEAALGALAEAAPDVALVDLHLPGMDGLAALEAIRGERPETQVVVMTAYSSVPTAVAAIKAGAADYLTKPLDLEELWLVVQRACETQRVRGELAYLRERTGHSAPVESLLGRSPAMDAVRQRIQQVARADHLGGRRADGARRAARPARARSWRPAPSTPPGPRRRARSSTINCAAIPADAAGERALRLREGRVHRRPREQAGALRSRGRRHALPRRDRAARPAGSRRSCCA